VIKEIVRCLSVPRASVRKVVRGEATRFKYDREVQPAPKLGAWLAVLTGILVAEAKLPRRERHCPSNLRGWARIHCHSQPWAVSPRVV
jgi:hypothetical protein